MPLANYYPRAFLRQGKLVAQRNHEGMRRRDRKRLARAMRAAAKWHSVTPNLGARQADIIRSTEAEKRRQWKRLAEVEPDEQASR